MIRPPAQRRQCRPVAVLAWIAGQGRYALIIGLCLGIVFPGLALAMRPMIAPLVVLLLFLAILRLGPKQISAGLSDLKIAGIGTILLQMILPLAAIATFWLFGILGHPVALGIILMLSAPPVTGSPHLAAMAGADSAPALRQLVIGTVMLPLTVLPVFWLIPDFGGFGEVILAVLDLLAIIGAVGAVALVLRRFGVVPDNPNVAISIDAAVAISLGAVVIGLMSAMGPALWHNPWGLALAIGAAFAINTLLQLGAYWGMCALNHGAKAPSMGIVAGNRNIALLLGVLPADLAQTLLLFIGCYQFPMYLTPILWGWLYRR